MWVWTNHTWPAFIHSFPRVVSSLPLLGHGNLLYSVRLPPIGWWLLSECYLWGKSHQKAVIGQLGCLEQLVFVCHHPVVHLSSFNPVALRKKKYVSWNIKNTIELPQSQQQTRRYMFPVKQQHHPTGSKVSHMHFMNKNSAEKTMMAVFFPMAEASSQIPCWLLQWPGNPEHSVIPLNECESYRRRISFLFTCICWLPLRQSIGGVDLLSGV